MRTDIARVMAGILGAFTLLNLWAEFRTGSFHPNRWWIDLRFVPSGLSGFWLLATAVLLLWSSFGGPIPRWARRTTVICCGSLAFVAAANAIQFWYLLSYGHIRTGMPAPFSLAVCGALVFIACQFKPRREAARNNDPSVEVVDITRPNQATDRDEITTYSMPLSERLTVMSGVVVCFIIGFPLSLMYCFGWTDYRRPADAIVVFGCKVYPDGEPSLALADRVETGCQLYHAGLASLVVFSGGPGEGAIHETTAMRDLALRRGVPESVIAVDLEGLNTWATVRNTSPLFERSNVQRIIAVSHFYHLPRVKLAYQRTGWDVYTVPAQESRRLVQLPFMMAREVAAFWAYYLRAITGLGLGIDTARQ